MEAKNAVNVEWKTIQESECLHIEIVGFLGAEIANTATEKWKSLLEDRMKDNEQTVVICDCENMKGYHADARKMWQQTMSETRPYMKNMWIVTDNKLFIIAAKSMGFITNFPLKTAKSINDVVL